MEEFVILLAIVIAVIGKIDSEIKKLQRRNQIERAKRIVLKTEQAILDATGDEEVARLVMWLRADLTPYTRYDARSLDKLNAICAKPHLALIAFQIVLTSTDENLQYVGIHGLAHLKDPKGITPLLEYYKSTNDFRDEATNALIELSTYAPIRGANGYAAVFKQILITPYSHNGHYVKIGYLEKLLSIALKRSSDFSDEEFSAILDKCHQYAEALILSENVSLRHQGEDFKKKLFSIKAQREWMKTERQRQERLHQQQQAQRRREKQDQERQRQEREQREREQQEQRERYRTHAERERQEQQRERQRTRANVIDYYKILQVDPFAEPEVIKGAYQRLAKKYHPDMYKEADATRRMQLLNEAYAVLSDPIERQRYDETRNQL